MPIPFILAGLAALAGGGAAIHGGVKMKEANDTMNAANRRHKKNIARFETQNKTTTGDMDRLGKLELETITSFQRFADIFERIQNRPEFKAYDKGSVKIPAYDGEELKRVYVGAGALLGGLGGAAAGTAGGFAAAGATTAAVMAFGTASTGTAIASLSGAALTNATLAAIGGGAVAAGGGGIAAGTAILGAATLGVGLLVGGLIFNLTGGKLSDKADKAWSQMEKAEKEINTICDYMTKLSQAEKKFEDALKRTSKVYYRHLDMLGDLVILRGQTNWDDFSPAEKSLTENTVLLVGLLYDMCKVKLVKQSTGKDEVNQVNDEEIDRAVEKADAFLNQKGMSALA